MLGHAIALSLPVQRVVRLALFTCRDTPARRPRWPCSPCWSASSTGGSDWCSARFARQVAEHAARKGFGLNYAPGRCRGLCRHDGLARRHLRFGTHQVAEAGTRTLMAGLVPDARAALLPSHRLRGNGLRPPTWSPPWPCWCWCPAPYLLGGTTGAGCLPLPPTTWHDDPEEGPAMGAERLTAHPWRPGSSGIILLVRRLDSLAHFAARALPSSPRTGINLLLLGWRWCCMAASRAFPAGGGRGRDRRRRHPGAVLYFGIMGLMRGSGWCSSSPRPRGACHTTTFPLFTFLSAAVVNVFVPSGGGQWAVQGPIIAGLREPGYGPSAGIMAPPTATSSPTCCSPSGPCPAGDHGAEGAPSSLCPRAHGPGAVVFCATLLLW